MKLNFIKRAINDKEVVIPINEETGETIESVIECSVDSGADRLTKLSLTVILPFKEKSK